MNILDTNIVINNIDTKKYEKGYITDITLFERFKSVSEETRIARFKELDNYVNNSSSVILCFDKKHHDDVFNQSISFETRYKNAMTIAIFAANQLWQWFTYLCAILTLCYLIKQDNYKFDDRHNTWDGGKGHNGGDAFDTAHLLINRLEQSINKNGDIGEKLLNEKIDINKQSIQLDYMNAWIKWFNSNSYDYQIPYIQELNGKWLKQGNKVYSDKFINSVINQFFRFQNNEEISKLILFSCVKEVLNGASFEFNDIADVMTIAIAKSKNIPLRTNDKVMRNIAKTMESTIILFTKL